MKCIILDDETIARKGMQWLVESRYELQLLGSFSSTEEAERFMKNNEVELIFLDIDMPGVTGLEFAKQLPRNCLVIFTTAYSEYALASYDVQALDYLIKPIDADRFNKAVDKAISYHSLIRTAASANPSGNSAGTILVKSDRKFVRVLLNDIIYIKGLKDYVVIHTSEKKIITRMYMKSFEEMLPFPDFLRINKSYIVNSSKIDSFNYNDVFVGDLEISISTMYREKVLAFLLGR